MASGRLKDKIAIVTGSSSGIGRAICVAYGREGAKVIVSDIVPTSRNPVEADITTHDLIIQRGGIAEFISADVTDPKSVDSLVEQVVKKHGRLDIFVNNAGIAPETNDPQPIWAAKDDIWNKTLDVNCNGVFYGLRAASRQMISQDPHPNGDRGWIVNLASLFGSVAVGQVPAYVSSKHLVLGLTKSAALDLAQYRVHCNAIQPGYIKSAFTKSVIDDADAYAAANERHPFRGMGEPDDVAGIAVFLASDDARWVTGTGVMVDGGYSAQ